MTDLFMPDRYSEMTAGDNYSANFGDQWDDARTRFMASSARLAADLREFACEQPLKTLGFALGLGYLAGRLIR
jgi:hypothetical protein